MYHVRAWPVVIAVLAGAAALPCSAELYLHPWEDQHTPKERLRVRPSLGFYSTSKNYGASGTAATPNGLNSLSRIDFDALGSYGLTDSFTFFARLQWSTVKLSITGRDSTSYGLGDQTLGASYRLFGAEDATQFLLQAQVDVPAYDNTSARQDNVPGLGDQTLNVTPGGFLRFVPSKGRTYELTATVGAGFTWRSRSYAAGVPWSAGLNYASVGSGLLGGAGAYGFSSLGSDARTGGVVAGGSSGGSFITEAAEPSLVLARASLGYRFSPAFDLSLTGAFPLVGKNAPQGTYVAVAAEIRLGGDQDDEDPIRQSPEEYQKSNKGFVEYTFEAKIIGTNDRLSFVKMNKGGEAGVEEGQIYDIFKPNPDGTAGKPVARAVVRSVKPGETVLSIKEYFREVWIEEGFIVKRPLR